MILLAPIPAPEIRTVTFRYVAPEAKSVNLAGSFNGWNKNARAMTKGADGVWTTALDVPAGSHRYKFVIDGEKWVTDPTAKSEGDGNGNINSVLLVLPRDYATPARIGDGRVTASALDHDSTELGRFYDRGKLVLRLRTRRGDVAKAEAHFKSQDVNACLDIPMRKVGSDDLYDRWTADVPWSGKGDLRYLFHLKDGQGDVYYGNGKTSDVPDTWFRVAGKTFRPFTVPGWTANAVAYQIFPDRFENGDKGNDPKDVVAWSAEPTYFNRYGGDAAGIRQRAGYLEELGVGLVYFNPVFASPSNHRYDTSDYTRIDPEIGTNAEFAAATEALKERGISSVLDIAFNHTATNHPWFLDLRENGPGSRYVSRYFPKSFPIEVKENPNYEAWFGFPSMPKLNVMDPGAKADLLSYPAFWRTAFPGVRGYRLDVANEVDERFWRAFRTRVKAQDPSAWIVGEEWGDASRWLKGDQWDASMNYPFREAALAFFARRNVGAKAYWSTLERVRAMYPPQVSRNQLNLLGSHDTPRWATLVNDRAAADLGAVMLLTWPGVPTVYYGDELGMEGGADPQNRRAMRWDLVRKDNPTLALYRKLIAARRGSLALRQGDPVLEAIDASDSAFAFTRTFKGDRALVAINRRKEATSLAIRTKGRWRDALSGRLVTTPISLRLSPMQGMVLLPAGVFSSSAASSAPQSIRKVTS